MYLGYCPVCGIEASGNIADTNDGDWEECLNCGTVFRIDILEKEGDE